HAVAREFGHGDVFEWLMTQSPIDVQLVERCRATDEAAARALVAAHPTVFGEMSEQARGRIADFAFDRHDAAVRVMLSCGWPADAMNDGGATALYCAAWHGDAA